MKELLRFHLALFAAPLVLIALLASAPAAGAATTSPPDILLIMPDQFRGNCLSALAHPVVRTPNLDALAAEGALFRRAYSTVPSCIPARYALLTGRAPQSSGVVGYAPHPVQVPTMGELLAQAGYATVLVGRNMHQAPATASPGYHRQIRGSTYIADDEYDRGLRQAAPESGGIRQVITTLGVDTNRWPANPWPLREELHPTNWVSRRSREVLAEPGATQPLFLTVSFYAPHPPLFPPARLFEKFLKATLPPVAMGDWVDRTMLRPEGDKAGHRILLQGETLRRAQAGYFGLIEHLDEQFGPLIAEFKRRSEKAGRPWLIVVTSDHGELLGDHGYFRKCEPYEGSANIPLLVAGSPSLRLTRSFRSDQPVCLEDIMPTLLEFAGAPRPDQIDGRSLVAALRGDRAVVRPWLHFEHAPIYGDQGFQALTDGRMKYIWRPKDGREQLFDLTSDPREEHDMAPVPAGRDRLARWRAILVQRLADRPEGFSDGRQLITNRPYRALNARAKAR